MALVGCVNVLWSASKTASESDFRTQGFTPEVLPLELNLFQKAAIICPVQHSLSSEIPVFVIPSSIIRQLF
jgi:hypothetical protein